MSIPRTNFRAYFYSQMEATVFIILQIFFAIPEICQAVICPSHQTLSVGFQNQNFFQVISRLAKRRLRRIWFGKKYNILVKGKETFISVKDKKHVADMATVLQDQKNE